MKGNHSSLMNIVTGNWLSQCIYVTVKLKIADYISEDTGKTVDELAELTRTDGIVLNKLLDILCEFKLCTYKKGMYFLTKEGCLLQSHSKDSLYAYIILNTELYAKIWGEFLQSIQTGVPAYKEVLGEEFFSSIVQKYPEQAQVYNMAMNQKYKQHNESIVKSYKKFSFFNTAVDVGAGMGDLLVTAIDNYPHLKGVLYDLPQVVSRASNKILEDKKIDLKKVSFFSGDFFKSIPSVSESDSPTLYILKSILHDWDDEKALMILKNCKAVMRERDALLIVEKALAEDEEISHHALMNLHMFLLHGGNERKLTPLINLICQAGFQANEPLLISSDGTKLIEAKPSIRAAL